MHDINRLDQLGIPGLMVATKEFKRAAAAQGHSLGFEPNVVWVEHPIQNRTEAELHLIADAACVEILQKLQSK